MEMETWIVVKLTEEFLKYIALSVRSSIQVMNLIKLTFNSMREIKFRAWNKTAKTMGDSFTLQTAIRPIDICNRFPVFTDDVIYMEYTGLKDKNEKEICEGDILCNGIIGFDRGRFCGMYFDSNGNIEESWEDDLYLQKDLEVMGNIYENPELLTK